jgi:hypothetical protein
LIVQHAAICQFDFAIGANGFYRDQFPVCDAATGGKFAIGFQMQPVIFRD